MKSVVLSSGGLDSTTVMAIAKWQGYDIYSLSFRYGQRHNIELEAAKKVADFFNVSKHLVVEINLKEFGKSALTDNIKVPKNRSEKEISKGIPITYVPARNTIFLAYALAWAEVSEIKDIFIGVNALDYSGYPDCRPEFIQAFEKLANLATKIGIENERKFKIHSPLIKLSKSEIIKKGLELGVDYSLTHSCYDPSINNLACGKCDSCKLRLKGFKEAGIKDPIKYEEN